jgi:hypothetical protein
MEVIHNANDLILTRWDNTNVVKDQGPNLLKLLPNWSILRKTNNNMLYSLLLTRGIDNIDHELKKVHDAIQILITDLNLQGKTISRIECWLHQSDDREAIYHPLNTNPDQVKLAQLNGDSKFSSWVFTDHHKDERGDNIWGNKFNRQIKKNHKTIVKKKYWVLSISSAWSSI